MAVLSNLSINFQHCCYSNVSANYGYLVVQDGNGTPSSFSPEFRTDLGSICLSPYFSLGSPEDGFPNASLKRITLRTTMAAGSQVGVLKTTENKIAETCGLSDLAWNHGNYLPRLGYFGWNMEMNQEIPGVTPARKVTDTRGMQIDFNTADLYTAQVNELNFKGWPLLGRRALYSGPSFAGDRTFYKGGRNAFAHVSAEMHDSAPVNDTWIRPMIYPQAAYPCNGPLILGKGWADPAQDNPKEFAQSEIYWNWGPLGSPLEFPKDPALVGSLAGSMYKPGTLTRGGGTEKTHSWSEDKIRPLAGAPIRFQTIPLCYESCERAYTGGGFSNGSEIPDKPLYKNGYFHALVSSPVLYRYRDLTNGWTYDDSCKDSQQDWLPHHESNLVLKAEDPAANYSCAVPYEGLLVQGSITYCDSPMWLGMYNENYNSAFQTLTELHGAEVHVTYGLNSKGEIAPNCTWTDGDGQKQGETTVIGKTNPPCKPAATAQGYPAGSVISSGGCCFTLNDRGGGSFGYIVKKHENGKYYAENAKKEINGEEKEYTPSPTDGYNYLLTVEGVVDEETGAVDPTAAGLTDEDIELWNATPDLCACAKSPQKLTNKLYFDKHLTATATDSNAGLRDKGPWNKCDWYYPGDIVTHHGEFYKCKLAHGGGEGCSVFDGSGPCNNISWKEPKDRVGGAAGNGYPMHSYYEINDLEDKADFPVYEQAFVKKEYDRFWELSCEPTWDGFSIDANIPEPTINVKGCYDPCDPALPIFDYEETYSKGDVVSFNGKVWKLTGYHDAGYEEFPGTASDPEKDWMEYCPEFAAVNKINLGEGLYYDYGATPGTCNWSGDGTYDGDNPDDFADCCVSCLETEEVTLRSERQLFISGIDCSGSGIRYSPTDLNFPGFVMDVSSGSGGCYSMDLCAPGGLSVSGYTGKCDDGSTGYNGGRGQTKVFNNLKTFELGSGLYIEEFNYGGGYPPWVDGATRTEGYYQKGDKVEYDGKCWQAIEDDTAASPDGNPFAWKEIECPSSCCDKSSHVKISATLLGIDVSGIEYVVSGDDPCYPSGIEYKNVRNFRLGNGLTFGASASGEDPCDPTGYVTLEATAFSGLTVRGPSGASCTGVSDYSTGLYGIHDFQLGSGLYIESFGYTNTGDTGCNARNYVRLASSSSLLTHGVDCYGTTGESHINDLTFYGEDFCVSLGDECDATIRSKGFTVHGYESGTCAPITGFPAWNVATQYEGGEKVRYLGQCYLATSRNKGDDPVNHSLPVAEPALVYWDNIPCQGAVPASPRGTYAGVKTISFGNGFNVEGSTGICCSGNEITVSTNTSTISGMDCFGSGYKLTPENITYDTGDFCLNIVSGTNCDTVIKSKGFTFSGTSGTVDCSGAGTTASALVYGVKDIRLGSGLYFQDYSTGSCCSGNHVTLGATSLLNVAGYDCSGTGQSLTVQTLNYYSGDFCVASGEACDAAIRTKGFTVHGYESATCAPVTGFPAWNGATQYEGGEKVKYSGQCYIATSRSKNDDPVNHSLPVAEPALVYWDNVPCQGAVPASPRGTYGGVKTISFGNGFNVAGSTGACCVGNEITVSTNTSTISGMDCFGSGYQLTPENTTYDAGDFCLNIVSGTNCDTVIKSKGFTFSGTSGGLDCSGAGTTASALVYGVKDIRLGSGLYFQDYSTGSCCSGNHVTLGATSLLNVAGYDCSGTGQSLTVQTLNYYSGDFCVAAGEACDAAIRTKGFTVHGYESGTCAPITGLPAWNGATQYEGGEKVKHLGQCYIATSRNKNDDPVNHSLPVAEPALVYWDNIPCQGAVPASPRGTYGGVKTISFGNGFSVAGSTGACCVGNEITVSTNTSTISGMDCFGSGYQLTPENTTYDAGDFCLNIDSGTNCNATIKTKGFEVQGYLSGGCATGSDGGVEDWNGSTIYYPGDRVRYVGFTDDCYVNIRTNQGDSPQNNPKFWKVTSCQGTTSSALQSFTGVKSLMFGEGLRIDAGDTGICCSGNSITISAASSSTISGADCSGSGFKGAVNTINYDTGHFFVDVNDNCDATIQNRGLTISGSDCSGSGVYSSSVREIRFGSGLKICESGSLDGCDSYIVLTSTAVASSDCPDCISVPTGSFGADSSKVWLYESYYTGIDTGCWASGSVACIKQDTGAGFEYFESTFAGFDNPASPTEMWFDGSFINLSSTSGGITICHDACPITGGCTGSLGKIIADSGSWDITGCATELTVSGCSGVYTTVNSGVLEICFTGNTSEVCISGADCAGSGFTGTVDCVEYDTGDFCVSSISSSGATIKTKGFTFSGTSGTVDCSGSGETASALVRGVKDIRLGSGLYFEDYSTGMCCSGNYVTIAAKATAFSGMTVRGPSGAFCTGVGESTEFYRIHDLELGSGLYVESFGNTGGTGCTERNYVRLASDTRLGISGEDCSGDTTQARVSGINYNPRDFYVSETGCVADLCTQGFTISGESGSGCWDAEGKITNVKDILLGTGLYMRRVDARDGCCSGTEVELAAKQLLLSGWNCSGAEAEFYPTALQFNSGDFFLERGGGPNPGTACDATLCTQGFTASGPSNSDDSSPWNAGTAYTAGNYVTHDGKCYLALDISQGNDPSNPANSSLWSVVDCCFSGPTVSPVNIKQLQVGSGLFIQSHTTGNCCSGNSLAIAAHQTMVSGYTCSGDLWKNIVQNFKFNQGDFFLKTGNNSCDVEICSEGFSLTGPYGGRYPDFKPFYDYGAGGTARVTYQGKCYQAEVGVIDWDSNFDPSEWTTIDCRSAWCEPTELVTHSNVKDIQLGSGLFLESTSSSDCCTGESITLNTLPIIISGVDCSGSGVDIERASNLTFDTGDFHLLGNGCAATIKSKGIEISGYLVSTPAWDAGALYAEGDEVSHNGSCYKALDVSQGNDPADPNNSDLWAPTCCKTTPGPRLENIKTIGFGSGLYIQSSGGSGCDQRVTVNSSCCGTLGAVTDSSGNIWNPGCKSTLTVTGANGITTSITSSGVLTIGYTGSGSSGGSGCANSIGEISGNVGSWSPNGCADPLLISGSNGIKTSVSSGLVDISYTGTFEASGCSALNVVTDGSKVTYGLNAQQIISCLGYSEVTIPYIGDCGIDISGRVTGNCCNIVVLAKSSGACGPTTTSTTTTTTTTTTSTTTSTTSTTTSTTLPPMCGGSSYVVAGAGDPDYNGTYSNIGTYGPNTLYQNSNNKYLAMDSSTIVTSTWTLGEGPGSLFVYYADSMGGSCPTDVGWTSAGLTIT